MSESLDERLGLVVGQAVGESEVEGAEIRRLAEEDLKVEHGDGLEFEVR